MACAAWARGFIGRGEEGVEREGAGGVGLEVGPGLALVVDLHQAEVDGEDVACLIGHGAEQGGFFLDALELRRARAFNQ